jgi:tetratricopeptide (TPR) repeat protein
MNSLIRSIGFIVLIFLFFPVLSNAVLVPEEEYRLSSQCILNGNYGEAEKVLNNLIAAHPNEPSGYLFKAALLQYLSIDYEDYSREKEYISLLDKAENLSFIILKVAPEDLWANYFFYAAQSMKGAKAASSGHLLSGVKKGRSGAKGMEWILSVDNNFYDAGFIYGCYRFWKSVSLHQVSWLPFLGDDRRSGIEEARNAIYKGKLTGPLCVSMLLQMFVTYDPPEAIALGRKMTAMYPTCRLFSWQLGEAYKKMGKYSDAVKVFSEIAESFSRDPCDDGSGQIRCWWKLAVLSKSLGKTGDCRKYCERIAALGEKEQASKRQKIRIERALKMLGELDGGTK